MLNLKLELPWPAEPVGFKYSFGGCPSVLLSFNHNGYSVVVHGNSKDEFLYIDYAPI